MSAIRRAWLLLVVLCIPLAAMADSRQPFVAYETAVICCVKRHEHVQPASECDHLTGELAVIVRVAESLRSAAAQVVASFAEPLRGKAEAHLKMLDARLALVKARLRPAASPGTPGGVPATAPSPVQPPVVGSVVIVDGGSRSKREQPQLYYWSDGSAAHFYLSLTAGELFEFEPRLYRNFLQEQLGKAAAPVAGPMTPELVLKDVTSLLASLRGSEADKLKAFAERFPLQEGAGLASYLERTTASAEPGKRELFAEVQRTLGDLRARRESEMKAKAVDATLYDYDRASNKVLWLRSKKLTDPWLMRDLLESSELDLYVRSSSGNDVVVPVRPHTKLHVSSNSEVSVGGYSFRPEQLRAIDLPATTP